MDAIDAILRDLEAIRAKVERLGGEEWLTAKSDGDDCGYSFSAFLTVGASNVRDRMVFELVFEREEDGRVFYKVEQIDPKNQPATNRES